MYLYITYNIYIYIHYKCKYIYIYIYMYIYIYVVRKTDNVPSRLLTIRQWSHGNMATHELGHSMCPSA